MVEEERPQGPVVKEERPQVHSPSVEGEEQRPQGPMVKEEQVHSPSRVEGEEQDECPALAGWLAGWLTGWLTGWRW